MIASFKKYFLSECFFCRRINANHGGEQGGLGKVFKILQIMEQFITVPIMNTHTQLLLCGLYL